MRDRCPDRDHGTARLLHDQSDQFQRLPRVLAHDDERDVGELGIRRATDALGSGPLGEDGVPEADHHTGHLLVEEFLRACAWGTSCSRRSSAGEILEMLTQGPLAKRPRAAPRTRGGTMAVLTDPVRPLEIPPRTPIEPAAPLEKFPPDPDPRLLSFELESPGGYARTIVGRIAWLDREANTYVVRDGSGDLIRVPRRDIQSSEDAERRPMHGTR
ncbi:MAG: hypothetical protein ACXVQ0_13110 [Actinomycetota bacterium]